MPVAIPRLLAVRRVPLHFVPEVVCFFQFVFMAFRGVSEKAIAVFDDALSILQ